MKKSVVGIIGLGQMGLPMAGNLLAAGHPVLGLDALPAQAQALAGQEGYRAAGDLAAMAAAQVVILMLPNSDIVDDVLWNQGLAASLPAGTLVIDMSSSNPMRTHVNAERLGQADLAFVDAPVSGGVKRAREGKLAIMMGGPDDAVARARPVLEALGTTLVHVGGAGSGHAIKALNNYISASGLLAVSEAMTAAQRFGIDPHVANQVFNASSGKNSATEQKVEQFMLSGTYASGFALALMRKDLETALGFMAQMRTPTAFASCCVDIWRDAEASLPARSDHTTIYRYVQEGG